MISDRTLTPALSRSTGRGSLHRTRAPAFDAEVTYVAPQLDPRSQTIRVKASVADAKRRLLPGRTVIVLLPEGEDEEARPREEEPRTGGGLFGR